MPRLARRRGSYQTAPPRARAADYPERAKLTSESGTGAGGASALSRGAVFLSYASEDTEAANRICEALRAAGIEVWFDRSELRGGDAWDAAIRRQIKHCALFIPVISTNTHKRREGYFRLEWKLGIDRSHLMAPDEPFLMPVAIDDTPQSDERVPERFREVQWIRLPAGDASAAFVARVQRLLSGAAADTEAALRQASPAPVRRRGGGLVPWWWVVTAALLAIVYWGVHREVSREAVPEASPIPPTPPSAKAAGSGFSPPPHSVAVLPFVNMSGDKAQDYFSDGLSEELLNSLARINDLQVAARTSSFSFKGKDVQIGTVARELNVAAVLEGSVRRSGNTVRITAQLVNAATGFHLWSQTYDRNLGDVLKLQTEIANAVAGALKVTLLGDEAAKIELGGTSNPAALDAYLRGLKAFNQSHDGASEKAAIDAFTEALKLDPNYALALAGRSIAHTVLAQQYVSGQEQKQATEHAGTDARRALELAPDLAQAHLAMGRVYEDWTLDLRAAGAEYERALALAPNNVEVLLRWGLLQNSLGRFDASIATCGAPSHWIPLNPRVQRALADCLQGPVAIRRRYWRTTGPFSLDPEAPEAYARRGQSYYLLGDYENARRSCEARPGDWEHEMCLAMTYFKLGRRARCARGNGEDARGDGRRRGLSVRRDPGAVG